MGISSSGTGTSAEIYQKSVDAFTAALTIGRKLLLSPLVGYDVDQLAFNVNFGYSAVLERARKSRTRD